MTSATTVSAATYLACLDQLPTIPSVILDALALCRKESVEVKDLARTLNKDPAVTARLLKIANSALYGGRGAVTTIEEAVLRLGTKSVMLATLAFSLTNVVPVATASGGYDLKLFWRRAMVESVAARIFAQRLQKANDAEAFTCGLLMDLGIPLFAKVLPDQYAPLIAAMDGGHPDVVDEQAAVDGDHGALSAFLLREWRLPNHMADSVEAHHDPDVLGDHARAATRDLARILNLAHLAAGVVLCEGRAMRLRLIEDKVAAWFGKGSAFVDGVLATIERGVKEFAEATRVSAEGMNPTQMAEAARLELVNLSLSAGAALVKAESKVVELEAKATTDALTGTCNRAFFDAAMKSEWDRRKTSDGGGPLGVLIVDVDHFKRFNDTYGHQTGDEVLRILGKTLRNTVRETDLVCRYGGEEFAVICPDTPSSALTIVAERIRKAVEAQPLKTPKGVEKVTVSIGTGVLTSKPATGFEALVECADSALYEAKRGGRNRVVSAQDL